MRRSSAVIPILRFLETSRTRNHEDMGILLAARHRQIEDGLSRMARAAGRTPPKARTRISAGFCLLGMDQTRLRAKVVVFVDEADEALGQEPRNKLQAPIPAQLPFDPADPGTKRAAAFRARG